jgi:hypothetical protein
MSPLGRNEASMATLGGRVVLFGGYLNGASPLRNDTSTFDGTKWTQASPSTKPPARYEASMAALGSLVVLFGGDDTNAQPGVSASPPARYGASLASFQ